MSFMCHYTRQGWHTLVIASCAAVLAYSTKFAYCKQRMLRRPGNDTSSWSFSSRILLSLLPHSPRLTEKNEARAKLRRRWINSVAHVNFGSGMGTCMGRVGLFKHLLRVTAHPHFLLLELRAPMGAWLRHYRSFVHMPPIPHNVTYKVDNTHAQWKGKCNSDQPINFWFWVSGGWTYSWTVTPVNWVVRNPQKHITPITFSSMPEIFSFKQLVWHFSNR